MADAEKPTNAFKAYIEKELAAKIDQLDPLGDAVKAYVNNLPLLDTLPSNNALAFPEIVFGYEVLPMLPQKRVVVFFYPHSQAGAFELLHGLPLRNLRIIRNHGLEELVTEFEREIDRMGIEHFSQEKENVNGLAARAYTFDCNEKTLSLIDYMTRYSRK